MLLRIGAFTLLTDPNFLHRGQRAHLGYGLRAKRLTEPALQPTQLPALDAILLSHMHGDHWDRIATKSLPKGTPVVTTQEAAKCLVRPRASPRPSDLAAWQTHELTRGDDTLRITSVPGVHGPGPLEKVLPQVMGSVLELVRGGDVSLAGLHQRRHALPAVPRRGARAVRPARRPHPAPRRHEGRSASP